MENDTQANSYCVLKDKTVVVISAALILLNLLDGGLTLYGLGLGIVNEVNPLMRRLIAASPEGFMVTKFLVPLIFGILLWKKRHNLRKIYIFGLWIVFLLYILAMLLHGYWISYLYLLTLK